MKLTDHDVQEILRLLDDTSYDELHLETGDFKLTLRRAGAKPGGWTRENRTLSKPNILNQAAAEAEAVGVERQEPPPALADGLLDVRAPMVGTFYRAPKPGAEPFIKIGSRVDNDTVVAIIEVMKLMNAIHAGVRGEVAEILIEDAQFVEKGALMMRVRPEQP